jgi:hypothetical protein
MHRSGTSALVRSLNEMGLYIGYDLEPNAEARYFLNLNEELLRMVGARWDNPENLRQVLKDEDLVLWLSKWLESKMTGLDISLYLSKPGWLKYRDIRNYPRVWGWKDPRNTLTLPIWLKLFPDAKVIHVVRHGVDVAASLRVREQQLRDKTLRSKHELTQWKVTSPLCLDLAKGFKLWETYMSVAEQTLSLLPEAQCHTLTFEDWLLAPEQNLNKLNTWLELRASEKQIHQVTSTLNAGRRFAFKHDAELAAFAKGVCPESPWLKQFYAQDDSC